MKVSSIVTDFSVFIAGSQTSGLTDEGLQMKAVQV